MILERVDEVGRPVGADEPAARTLATGLAGRRDDDCSAWTVTIAALAAVAAVAMGVQNTVARRPAPQTQPT